MTQQEVSDKVKDILELINQPHRQHDQLMNLINQIVTEGYTIL